MRSVEVAAQMLNNQPSPSIERKLTFGFSSTDRVEGLEKPGWAVATERIFEKQFKGLESM